MYSIRLSETCLMKKKNNYSGLIRHAAFFLIAGVLWILLWNNVPFWFIENANTLATINSFKPWVSLIIGTALVWRLMSINNSSSKNLVDTLKLQIKWQRQLIANLPEAGVFLIDDKFNQVFDESTLESIYLHKIIALEAKRSDSYCFGGEKPVLLKNALQPAFTGKKTILGIETSDSFYEIHALPVNETYEFNGVLLIVFDRTQQRELIRQISNERKSFAKLSSKYHALNSELSDSYKQLQTYNKELIENKERYTAFIQQTSEAVYRMDMKKPIDLAFSTEMQVAAIVSTGYLAEYNTSFGTIYNLDPDRNHIGKSQVELYPESNQVQSQELIRELVQHNYVLKDHESVEYDGHGRTRYFLNNFVGIVEDGRLIRFWGTKFETTRQKKYERELILAKKDAEKSDKLKSAFLANMSHEIRTPLNGILGFSELVCNAELADKKKKKYFNIIQASNQQLLRIINDILDISRLQTGQLSIEKTEFSVNNLMDEIESYLKVEIDRTNKNLELVITKNLDNDSDTICTDKERLYQVVTNLANNAIKFTEKGKVTIAYEEKASSVMEFSIDDTGIGIPGDYLGSIFDQFRQVEEFANRNYGGTGLGLSISKGLVELLGGYIAVESEPGVGSRFKFTIKHKQ